tara:strand:- start:1618 stop:1842 length:225 start_codon:yes stop_codon:yes gene_type:complete
LAAFPAGQVEASVQETLRSGALSSADLFLSEVKMKIRNSLKALMTRHRDNKLVRRRGRVYIINKVNKRMKARQG